jgi:hypothetical protein
MRKRKSKRSAEFVHLVVYDEDGRLEDRISVGRNLRLKFFFTRSKVCKKRPSIIWPGCHLTPWSQYRKPFSLLKTFQDFWSSDLSWSFDLLTKVAKTFYLVKYSILDLVNKIAIFFDLLKISNFDLVKKQLSI